jgi:5-methylcytosine-specific restriction endonuclease McrA
MNKDLGPKILKLREEGYSYNDIAKELGCAKSTISYHCSRNKRKQLLILRRKREKFISKKKKGKSIDNSKANIRAILISKVAAFYKGEQKLKRNSLLNISKNGLIMFTVDDLINKIGDNPKCYLTGKDIDLSKSKTYSLDHIVPRSKGGENSLDNCGLCCKEANMAKYDLLLEDFISLCDSVVKNFSK